jgi:hypothetical protein
MSEIRYKIDDAEVRKVLSSLPRNVAQRVQKKGMRTALQPVRNDLRQLWRNAQFRGKTPHRKAIASATKIDVRRQGSGPRAVIAGEVGVVYGRKGGAGAKGRQKVWHLLEHGFRHFGGSGGIYLGRSGAAQAEAGSRRTFIKTERDRVMQQFKGNSFEVRKQRGQAMKAVFAAARERFQAYAADAQERRLRIKNVRSSGAGRNLPGRKLSTTYIRRNMRRILTAISQRTLLEARAALRGQP